MDTDYSNADGHEKGWQYVTLTLSPGEKKKGKW